MVTASSPFATSSRRRGAEVEGVLYREARVKDDKYCLWVDDDYYLDMVDQTRWINHSCDPNSEIEAELDGQGGAWARVVATRPIRSGEELTYDYGFPEELAEPCSCGTDKCTGWIVDTEQLPAARRAPRSRSGRRRAASRIGIAAGEPKATPLPGASPLVGKL